jgi:hypothetical protein
VIITGHQLARRRARQVFPVDAVFAGGASNVND